MRPGFAACYRTRRRYMPARSAADTRKGDSMRGRQLLRTIVVVVSTALAVSTVGITAASAAPTVTSLNPTSGPVGTIVTITGTGFTGATAVEFNGVAASSFTVDSDTQIRATVPAGATTGV